MLRSRLLWVLAMLAAGCVSTSDDPIQPLPGSGAVVHDQAYPDGPYGTTPGSVIVNYAFPGYALPAEGIGESLRTELKLGDFFNPTGEELYGPDDPFPEGQPKPKALIINVSAVWCAPCKDEAKNHLPPHYAELHPRGLQLLLVLADSETPGRPAAWTNLDNWVQAFPVSYPSVLDPAYQLGALFDTSSYPANFLIDPRDMTIIEIVKGIPQQGFWTSVEGLLDK